MSGAKAVFRKIAKVTGWFVLAVILLIIVAFLLIRLPAVQNRIVDEAASYLSKKIGTEVRIGKIYLAFPKQVVMTDLFFADQNADTLLSAKRLAVDTDLWGLLHNRIELNSIGVQELTAKVSRHRRDSAFNFGYILNAFATPASETDSTAKPWVISMSRVTIEHGSLSFLDSLSGIFARSNVGRLHIVMDQFDLNNSIFKADEIALDSVRGDFLQRTDSIVQIAEQSVGSSLMPTIGIKNLKLKAVRFRLEQDNQVFVFDTQETVIHPDVIDLNRQVATIQDVKLIKTMIQVHMMKSEPVAVKELIPVNPEPFTLSPWTISVADLDLSGLSVQYYDFNAPVQNGGIDFNHLWISGVELRAKSLFVDSLRIAGEIGEFSFHERSGIGLRSLQGEFMLDQHELSISKFSLDTDRSHLALTVSAHFPSLRDIAKKLQDVSVDFELHPSHIAASDVILFQPHWLDSLPVRIGRNETLRMEAHATGKIGDLSIGNLSLTALDSTHLELYGSIKGLPDFRHAEMNVTVNKLYTSRHDLTSFLPDSLQKNLTHVPPWLHFKGDFKGSLQQPQLDGILVAGNGSVEMHVKVDSVAGNYSGRIRINDFHLGEVLADTAIGRVSLTAEIAGSGFSMDKLRAEVDVHVDQFEYRHYSYTDFKLKGTLNKYFFSGVAAIQDKNLDMNLNADLDYNGDVPHYKLTLDLRVADLKALHLSHGELKTRGVLDLDLSTTDYRRFNGDLSIRKFAVFNGINLYKVDSLLFASIDQDGSSQISIRSDIVSGDFKGTIDLFSLPATIRRHLNYYFSLRDTAYNRPQAEQNFKFELVLKDTDLLTEILIPDLDPFVPGEIRGEYNSTRKKLELRFGISKIRYAGFSADSIRLDVISDAQKMNYALALKDVRSDTLRISGLKFSGQAAHDSLTARFTISDSLRKEKYLLGGVITSLADEFQLRILQDELLLNYEPWETPTDNYLRFGGTHMMPHNFEISKDQERVALEKVGNTDSVTALIFSNLNLENVTSLVEGVTPIGGIAEGDFTVSVAKNQSFTSRLRIHGFTLLNQTWGDLDITLHQQKGTPYKLEFGVEGEKAMIKIAGTYSPDPKLPTLDLNAQLIKLDLSAIQPLSFGRFKKMEGTLTGEMKIRGSISKPDVNGSLSFKRATIVPSAFNSAFSLNDETLTLKSSAVVFRNFKITDEKNDAAVVNGTIGLRNDFTFGIHLDIHAKNFQVMNSTAKDNSLFYGKMSITSTMRIRGTTQQPRIAADLSVSDKSNFTFVVPQSEKGVQEQKGIVEWVDRDAVVDPFLVSVHPLDTVKTVLSGVEISTNIDLKDTETFNIVIDPVTGDKLSVRGNSSLTFFMGTAGEMRLSGRYDITAGTYDFSFYKLVKRNFVINKGSYITWTGDPFDATLDITAVYKVETAPLELILNQVTTNNQQELNTYKQRLPFLVDLNIKGALLSPDISFKLDMPQDKQNAFGGNIYAVIQDLNTRESDLNKQVFSLLVLQRFMTDNPLESQSGDGLRGTARSSVSAMLTQQLNRLSQNVKGIQLNFDVKSYQDYASGNAQGNTQLQLGVSKSLLNDRLVVKVAGNVSVEGSATQQNSAADYIGDLALEYKLTQDGRLRISGFRNSNYDMIDGELIETGAGLIYIKDYNAFSELFKANDKTP